MRRRKQYANAKPPEINLVPMLDVLMTVLTFFIILSMVLGSQNSIDVELPTQDDDSGAPDQSPPPPPLLIEVDRTGKTLIVGRSIPIAQLKADVQNYLKNPKGVVLIQPNPDLPYEKVLQLIGELRDVGNNRVTLAVGADVSKAALTPENRETGAVPATDGDAAEPAPNPADTAAAADETPAEAPAETTAPPTAGASSQDTGDGPGLD